MRPNEENQQESPPETILSCENRVASLEIGNDLVSPKKTSPATLYTADDFDAYFYMQTTRYRKLETRTCDLSIKLVFQSFNTSIKILQNFGVQVGAT